MIWLFVPVTGLLHRLRGSYLAEKWFGFGLGLARLLIWSFPLSLLAWWLGYGGLVSLCLLATFFLGSVYGQPGHLNMGRIHGLDGRLEIERTEWEADASAALMRGCCWVSYSAMVLACAGHSVAACVLFVAGHLCPVAYELGWRTPTAMHEFERGAPWGEFYFGAVIGAALLLGAYLPVWFAL